MSEEIKVLIGLGTALCVAVWIFMKCCKSSENGNNKGYVNPKPPRPLRPPRPPCWGLESGTKVIFELDGKAVGGVVAGFNSGKYAIKRIYHVKGVGSRADYHIVDINNIIPVKEGKEND